MCVVFLAACQTRPTRIVFDYPGTDQTSARFLKDRAECRFEAARASASVRNDVDRLFAEAKVMQACMEARSYRVTSELKLV